MSNLIFNPIVPITFMSVFVTVVLAIILLNRKHVINRIIILALIFIISQRPMVLNQEEVTFSLNLDVIFVVDTTFSMYAEDVKTGETRFDVTKTLMKKIIDELPGSRFAVISHNNAAYLKYPFTFDNAAILSVIDSLAIVEPNYAAGSQISRPAAYLKLLLNSSAITNNNNKTDRKKIVFYFGDGEVGSTSQLSALTGIDGLVGQIDLSAYKNLLTTDIVKYDELKELVDGGAIFGTGTVEGGKILAKGVFDDKKYSKNGYVINYDTQKPYVSYLDEEVLKDLASRLGIDYMNAESNKINDKINEIKGLTEQDITDEKVKKASDTYYYFTFALALALIYELYYYRRNEL